MLETACGGTHREVTLRTTARIAQIVERIRRLNLQVALHKSEALFFYGPQRKPPESLYLLVVSAAS